MKIKNKDFFDEEFSSKKKIKPRLGFQSKNKFEENGIVTDRFGNLIKVGSFVEFEANHSLLEGEVVEIQSNNELVLIVDNEYNEVSTYFAESPKVVLLQF